MNNLVKTKETATKLRKDGKLDEALMLYRDLWKENGDKFDGCGLLFCLRNLDKWEEALPLANELIIKYPDFDWGRNEVIWTYIQGKLNKFSEEESLENIKSAASQIMDLKPKELALKTVVFKVLKTAKLHNNWSVINEWIVLVDPKTMNTVPMKSPSGTEGWSDRGLWYNYRIRGLIEKWQTKDELNKAIELSDEALIQFVPYKKFFLRLRAKAYHCLGDLNEAERIYQILCSNPYADWWLLYEHALILKELGRDNEALPLMYQAANLKGEPKGKVSLYADIGTLNIKLGKSREAFAHFTLVNYIRKEHGWSTPPFITNAMNTLITSLDSEGSLSKKEAYDICQNEWTKNLPKRSDVTNAPNDQKREGLVGNINLGKSEQSFAFIFMKGENIFCFKSDLPVGIKNGDIVRFNAVRSFDKKKNAESWRGININVVPNQK
jgi:tetratricopeptide (TPR) repeat protein